MLFWFHIAVSERLTTRMNLDHSSHRLFSMVNMLCLNQTVCPWEAVIKNTPNLESVSEKL